MAGNLEAHAEYMEAGHNAAWDQDWPTAIKQYTAAARENPDDPEAHIHLGMALLRSNRLEEALRVYQKAQQLAPDDPVPQERSADILEHMGRLREAAQAYVRVSDVYLALRDLNKAIANWERATQLTPGLVAVHAKLAQAYERVGDKRKAIREYLTLAYNFRRDGDVDKAIKAVERALRLDRNNSQALNMLSALRSGADIAPIFQEVQPPKPRPRLDEDFFDTGSAAAVSSRERVGESDPLGPMGEAMVTALTVLAEHVVESGAMADPTGMFALQAMEFQRQERYEEALDAYEQAEPGLRHPALKLNLGVLLVLQDEPEKALKHLNDAIIDQRLQAGALHAIGTAYYKLGRQKQAARFLIQSLQAVDSALAVDEDEEAELESVYERLYTALEDLNDEMLAAGNEKFARLLTGKDWKQRVAETRRQMDELMRSGDIGIIDIITTSGADELTAAVGRVDRYMRQGLLTLAMDEAHRAIEAAPFYLPVHFRMAEIMLREGRVRQAINKFNVVARAYLVRGESERAASILTEALEHAPLDITIRESLIELLETEGRWADSLEQHIDLARTYHQLGNFESARETFAAAERLGKRIEASPERMVEIKHSIAELDQARLDIRRAQRTYEEILGIDPENERAYRMLVDIHYNAGNEVEATRRLDQLLGLYAKKKQVSRIVQTLEELVRHFPTDSGLRSRLAGIYRQLGRKSEAIQQLDALGELQLDAGLHRDAINTIKLIIKLRPDNEEDYRKLLGQLGG
jgi:tetratricopeptide (TPR) repeat protein